jgi:hypothetical protein
LNHDTIILEEKTKCNTIAISLRIIAYRALFSFSSHQFFKQYYRSFLIQGLVIIAALGRLHAGRAAVSAGTFFHGFQSSLPELPGCLVSLLSDANASGVGIVNKNLRLAGIGMEGSGNAANVIAVAKGK